jgi:Putative beta-barrel porin-2, OmpL-like. bbp2
MKITPKHIHNLAVPLLALGMAVTLSPALKAQVQAPTAAQSSTSTPETQQRLEDLEKEVNILQREIVTLKESDSGTPTMRTAALVEPVAQGQAPADAAAPAAATPPADTKINLAGLLGPTTFSGYVDAYYSFNFNQPGNLGPSGNPNGIDGNGFRFFDENTNQFSLNSIEAVVDRAPDATAGGTGRAGYHIGIIYGQAAQIVNGTNNATDASNLALKEAYVDYIAPIGKGLTLTFGKFVTPAGAEVIESNGNWNYSRSILFYYAIPFFHFGANAKYTFNSQWAVTGYLVNGWNNTKEVNTGKTYGVSLAYTPNKQWTVIENYMAGPQDDQFFTGYVGKPNDNYRQLSDTVITYAPSAKWNFIVNGDYGYGDKFGNFTTTAGNSKSVDWWGAAGYAKYAPNDKSYFAFRYEYYSDPQGFTMFGFGNNGHAGEGTATYAYNWTSGLQSRFEFREDYSNRGFFEKGARFVQTQPALEVGLIYTFNSTNAK